MADDLSRASRSLADVASTLGDGRSHMAVRAALLASSVAEAVDALRAIAANKPHEGVLRGTAVPGQASEWAFLFTGQGSQYPGMGRVLYERAPVFREIIDRCDALLGADAAGRTLKTVLWDSSEPAPIHETSWTQPALFALEYGDHRALALVGYPARCRHRSFGRRIRGRVRGRACSVWKRG